MQRAQFIQQHQNFGTSYKPTILKVHCFKGNEKHLDARKSVVTLFIFVLQQMYISSPFSKIRLKLNFYKLKTYKKISQPILIFHKTLLVRMYTVSICVNIKMFPIPNQEENLPFEILKSKFPASPNLFGYALPLTLKKYQLVEVEKFNLNYYNFSFFKPFLYSSIVFVISLATQRNSFQVNHS